MCRCARMAAERRSCTTDGDIPLGTNTHGIDVVDVQSTAKEVDSRIEVHMNGRLVEVEDSVLERWITECQRHLRSIMTTRRISGLELRRPSIAYAVALVSTACSFGINEVGCFAHWNRFWARSTAMVEARAYDLLPEPVSPTQTAELHLICERWYSAVFTSAECCSEISMQLFNTAAWLAVSVGRWV